MPGDNEDIDLGNWVPILAQFISLASWLVQEVLQHYLRQKSKPICVILDCTKAFDLARFDILFGRLLERIPAIVVRVLSYSYKEQLAWVR